MACVHSLFQIGICEVAVRKRIMCAIASIHKKVWDMPEDDRTHFVLRYCHSIGHS